MNFLLIPLLFSIQLLVECNGKECTLHGDEHISFAINQTIAIRLIKNSYAPFAQLKSIKKINKYRDKYLVRL